MKNIMQICQYTPLNMENSEVNLSHKFQQSGISHWRENCNTYVYLQHESTYHPYSCINIHWHGSTYINVKCRKMALLHINSKSISSDNGDLMLYALRLECYTDEVSVDDNLQRLSWEKSNLVIFLSFGKRFE